MIIQGNSLLIKIFKNNMTQGNCHYLIHTINFRVELKKKIYKI